MRIAEGRVFSIPRRTKRSKSGIIITTAGMTIIDIVKLNKILFPRKSMFEKAYPARLEKMIPMKTEIKVIIVEFSNHVINCCPLRNDFSKFVKTKCMGGPNMF
jgi:hypothetical protein